MAHPPPRLGPALRLACLLCASPLAAAQGRPEAGDTIRGSLSSTLYSDSMAMRLGLRGGSSYLGLGLDSGEDGSCLQGCLYLSSLPERNLSLAAGPGSASGSLRLLVDPTSLTALSPGPLVEVDRSLSSRSAVLGLCDGPFSFFGIAEGRGAFAFASRRESPAGAPRSMGAGAGGFSLHRESAGLRFEALAAASYAGPAASSSGWRPDPYPACEPCAGAGAAALADGALIVERAGEKGRAIAAVSGSYGRLSGPALAFRLETRAIAGPFDLGLRAAAGDPAFRSLFAKSEERLASAAAEARLAFRRSGSVSASVETEAAGRGRRYAPLWGKASALKLLLPFGAESPRSLEAELGWRRSPEGIAGGACALALNRGRAEEGGAASLSAALAWEEAFEGLTAKLSTRVASGLGLPFLDLDIGLKLFDRGSAASPVLAKGGIAVCVPWGGAGSLELDADLPEEGIGLEPIFASRGGPSRSAPTPMIFRLRYLASFSAGARRPRSRSSAGPKASSIAQRAAS
jgi:hypothetical protein